MICPWCDREFQKRANAGGRRSGGSEQRFCSAPCRLAYHVAARRLGQALVESGKLEIRQLRDFDRGLLTVDSLDSISLSACTLPGRGKAPADQHPIIEPS